MNTYLDHNATTPLEPRVLETMQPYLGGIYGNPSSVHRYGRATRNAIDRARQQVADLVGVTPAQVIFTSGGTEANNMVFAHLANQRGTPPGHLLVSDIEHPSVLAPAKRLEGRGWRVERLPVDREGRVDPAELEQRLCDDTRLVSVMWANNETGVVQDVETMARLVVAQGIDFHTDAVQAAGKLALDFTTAGTQLMSLSAHKLYGPQGIGALIVDKRIDLEPLLIGGDQEQGLRAGTENVAAIVGFGRAAELAAAEMSQRAEQALQLRIRLEAALSALEGVQIHSQAAKRLPNTVMFSLPGIEGETLLMNLDRAGFAVSSGSACKSGRTDPSHVLLAMGVELTDAQSAVRVSVGRDNTSAQVDALVAEIEKQYSARQAMAIAAPA